ncbi:MAG: chitobiase/beta-hexosaminidase C-terminal domain-containing protein [Dysgonamonadaceae bacterium]|jgi:hypothetical protein|nr:chitobiase/beta-hexosaminidase C-terminal domain-containing protein [Dysgonamonadaceae bacterium]
MIKKLSVFLLVVFSLCWGKVYADCDYPTSIGGTTGSTISSRNVTTEDGWLWNCCKHSTPGGTNLQINGSSISTYKGYIRSPLFGNGLNAISFAYTKATGKQFKVEIKQEESVVWDSIVNITADGTFEKENLGITGDFQFVLTNTTGASGAANVGVIAISDLCLTKNAAIVAPSAPSISITGDTHPELGYWGEATVTLSAAADASIYYTTDDTEPTAESALYEEPLKFTETTRVKAIAVANELSSTVLDTLITVTAIPENMVSISITMNSNSPKMTLTPKGSEQFVTAGTGAGNTYCYKANPGEYILTGYTSGDVETGTIELTISDDAVQSFSLTTVSAFAYNSGWALGTDYEMECFANSREGISRVITVTNGSVFVGRGSFLMHVGDTYTINYTVSEARVGEGFLPAFNYTGTVTAGTASASPTIPKGTVYSILVPKEASVYVGGKRGAITQSTGGVHYVAFTESVSDSSKVEGDSKKRYYYTLGDGCNYNFKVSQPGKLTNGGKFKASGAKTMEITEDRMNIVPSNYINHNTANNEGANVADILMNINAYGYLRLKSGDTHQMLNLRSWQLTDNSTNNYFIEPDFHYKIIGIDGNPSNDVIEIDENQVIRTKGRGTAIVQVTYDAIDVRIDGTTPFYYGALWSALWPENTGTFVVTVDEPEDAAIVRNMTIQEDVEAGRKNYVDSEHDVFYYLATEPGYTYTFKPDGVSAVSVANPTLESNISVYTGFRDVMVNDDGSYTVLLTFGRNIIRLTSETGASEYQVITAKPVSYEIVNATNPGEPVQRGDKVTVQFEGFYHPANKLAGIYNMSAYITYNGIPNGTSLILSPNQYQFAGSPVAQSLSMTVPADWDTASPLVLDRGAIQINGYGSMIGKHRDISITAGINPNFTAPVHVDYFGSIPEISIPVHETLYRSFSFAGLPDGAAFRVLDGGGAALEAGDDGRYEQTLGRYSYEATLDGYSPLRGIVTVSSTSPELQEINLVMQPLGADQWDGKSLLEPQRVTVEESETASGPYEGMEGFYKISKGGELAWFSDAVNAGNNTISAVLTADIDLAGFAWTRIGNNSAAAKFAGVFDGAGYTVSGLYIDTNSAYQALFGYISDATVKNLTVAGSVRSTVSNAYTAGLVAYAEGNAIISNCHNYVTVSGTSYAGGILAWAANSGISITDCTNNAPVTASANYAGGIAGGISGGASVVLDGVSNNGVIYAGTNFAGGIAGRSDAARITNAYNTGSVNTPGAYCGGISGNINASSVIANAYNAGNARSNAVSGTAAGNRTNIYALGEVYTDANVMTSEDFASGEVAWLLGSRFGQDIGEDLLPVLDGGRVYRVTSTDNLGSEYGDVYTNGALPDIVRAGYSASWQTLEGAPLEVVEGDAELAILFTLSEVNGLTAEPSSSSMEISWESNVAATGYDLYLDGVLHSTVTGSGVILRDLEFETQYVVDVEAFDEYGNRSQKASVVRSTLTGIPAAAGGEISVYPNPFTEKIVINSKDAVMASVYDLQGRKALHVFLEPGVNIVDATGLPVGVYVLRYGSVAVKIVKQ